MNSHLWEAVLFSLSILITVITNDKIFTFIDLKLVKDFPIIKTVCVRDTVNRPHITCHSGSFQVISTQSKRLKFYTLATNNKPYDGNFVKI